MFFLKDTTLNVDLLSMQKKDNTRAFVNPNISLHLIYADRIIITTSIDNDSH